MSENSEQNPSAPTENPAAAPAPEAQPPLTWPEDIDVPEETRCAFLKLADDLKLPSQTAQQLVDFEAGLARTFQAEQARQTQARQTAWAEEIKQIYGPQWEEEMSRAVRAADVFGGPELRALLEESGLGNHPVIVRTFNRIGKSISEDASPLGKISTTGGSKTFAEAMYGNLK